MKMTAGDKVKNIHLPSLDGSTFDLVSIKGKRYLLTFFRFAGCPFCNLRLHNLVAHFDEFGPNFTIVGIFDASLQDLQRHARKHNAPFTILADESNSYYKEYDIRRSLTGTLKGAVVKFPSVLYSMFVKGYFPTSIGGNVLTMPADFLVDEEGIIKLAHYGKDEGDHISIETIKEFSNK